MNRVGFGLAFVVNACVGCPGSRSERLSAEFSPALDSDRFRQGHPDHKSWLESLKASFLSFPRP